MATEKQINANRLNARRGGVKTAAGKAVSRLNAVSHGFFSNDLVLPGEDNTLLVRLRDRFMAELKPRGELETILVERFITVAWRLKRLIASERKQQAKICPDYRFASWQNQQRYEITLERQMYKALHELERLRNARLVKKSAGENNAP